MVTLKINGKKLKVKEGLTVLEAARSAGIEIPTLCSNDALEPYGACRLCIVEISKNGRTAIESSCTYPAEEGLAVKTDSPRVIEGRKLVLELLLARCPNVKKVQQLAVAAYKAIDCAGMARVDFLLEHGTDRLFVNEINTIPGFTPISMYPKLWEASGISYSELIDRLIALALERHQDLHSSTFRK